jgi:chemotaxis family two-component system response regulator PixG
MEEQKTPYSKSLNYYLRLNKLQTLLVLKRRSFSGQIVWTNPQNHQWTLFFNHGRVIYGNGGLHPIRQWYRHVQAQLPQQDLSYAALQQAILDLPEPVLPGCWDYQLLYHWYQQGVLTQPSFQDICQQIVADLLFDIVQAENTRYELMRQAPLPAQLVPIAIAEDALLTDVKDLLVDWFRSDVSHCSPNLAPVVKHPEPIQAEVSPHVFATLMQLLDGQRSLRDLAVKLGQDVLNLTYALYPYIKTDWIELRPLADFPRFWRMRSPLRPPFQRMGPL